MTTPSPEADQIAEVLESLSNQEGYEEAAKLRRNVIEAHDDALTWESLSASRVAKALATWIERRRWGNADTLQPLSEGELLAAAEAMKAALERHRDESASAQALSVDAFGDMLQALWSVLRGPEEAEIVAEDDDAVNGVPVRADFSMRPKSE